MRERRDTVRTMSATDPNSPSLHNARALGWVSFFTDTASAMVTVLLPIFLLRTLGQTPEKLGFVVAIGTFVSFAFRWLAGFLSDYTQRPKSFAGAGYLVSAVCKPALALCQGWLGVALLRVGDRLGKAARSAPRDVLIASQAKGRTSEAFSLHKVFDLAGELTGLTTVALVFFFWSDRAGELVRPLLFATALPGAIAVAVLLIYAKEPDRIKDTKQTVWTFSPLPKEFVLMACCIGLLVEQPMLLGRLVELEVSGVAISASVMAALFCALLVTRRFRGQMTDARTIIGAIVVNLVALPLAIVPSAASIMVALAAVTASQALLLTAGRSRLAMTRRTSSGTVYGSFYLVIAVVGALITSLGGWFWQRYDFVVFVGALWGISAIIGGAFVQRLRIG